MSLSIDDKLAHICDKINNLEESNRTLVTIAHSVNQNSVQVNQVNLRMNRHEQLLRLLAYKSIDSEARSRRRNLVFHGLAENRNEDCSFKLGQYLWDEMNIDIDDLYIERVHRLGSLQKARQKTTDPNEPLRRPVIVAFNDTRSVNRALDNAHTLRGSGFSVTRDFPLEIVKARRALMPQFIKERQNRQNKVSIEYPAKLTVNGKTVCDAFPDWFTVLQQDRYEAAVKLGQPINPSDNTARVDFVQNGPHQVNYTPQPPPSYHPLQPPPQPHPQ